MGSPTSYPPIPPGPVDRCPVLTDVGWSGHTVSAAANYDALLDAFHGVELGEYDETVVAWLAQWDWSTVTTICSLITRAREAGARR